MMVFISSASLYFHLSSLGPAWIVSRGILCAAYSIELCITDYGFIILYVMLIHSEYNPTQILIYT